MNRRVLSIDLETYSDIDLPNCGVYRYVEGDFHILLFAYAFDDEDVQCVDMACGEQLPQEVVDAIHDDSIIKSAWNAQFERTCLSKYFGEQLSPDSWQCSMVWAASLSLPLKLKNAAEALKTGEQKDDAGERLIRYFSIPCKPTKTNGGRTRNTFDENGNLKFNSDVDFSSATITYSSTVNKAAAASEDGDTLTSDVTDGHYITPEQAGASGWLTVTKSNDENGTYVTCDASAYTIKFYGKNGNEITDFVSGSTNAVKIEVCFNDDIDAKYVKIHYSSTADLNLVNNGETKNYINTASVGNSSKTDQYTLTRNDPSTPRNFHLKFNKKWSDSNNAKGERPDTVTIQVQRSTDPTDSSSWENVGEPFTFNANSTYGEETFDLKENNDFLNYPEWNAEGEWYYYQLVETLADGSTYVVQTQDPVFKADLPDNDYKTYSITNTMESSLKKTALAFNGTSEINSVLKDSLDNQKVTIDGTEYYLFHWKVELYLPVGTPQTVLQETLPNGALFVTQYVSSEKLSNQYLPMKLYNYNSEQQWYNNNDDIRAEQNGRDVTITIPPITSNDLKYITYYTAVPVSTFEETYLTEEVESNVLGSVSNTIKLDGNVSTATLEILDSEPIVPSEPSAITKSYVQANQRGKITYQLDVNPEEKMLSDNGVIQITDKLSLANIVPATSDVEVTLESITVYPYLDNGEPDRDHPISSFDYVSKTHTREDRAYSIEKASKNLNGNNVVVWQISGWEPGDLITVTANRTQEAVDNNKAANAFLCYNNQESGINTNNGIRLTDVDGVYQVSDTIPNDAKQVYVVDWCDTIYPEYNNYQAIRIETIDNLSASVKTPEYPGILTIDVPDEQHVLVEYSYSVSGYSDYTVERVTKSNGQIQAWKITGIHPGDEIAAMIQRAAGVDPTERDVCYFTSTPPFDNINENYDGGGQAFTGTRETFTISDNQTELWIVDLGKIKNGSSFALDSTSGVKTTPSVKFNNEASYNEKNGSGSSSQHDNEMQVNYSDFSITVTKYPEIYKTDVGSDKIDTLAAQFKIAKYVKGTGWVYASGTDVVTIKDKKVRTLVFPTADTGYEGYTEVQHSTATSEVTYPPGAAIIAFDNNGGDNSVHYFNLDEREVYKFVEVVAPKDYQQPDWEHGGMTTNKNFVFCYAYAGAVKSDYPEEVQTNLKTWTKDSRLNIPNNNRITVKAHKTFSGASAPSTSEVELTLYYSTNKNGRNKQKVDSNLIGDLPNGWSNPITMHFNEADETANTVSWSDLPSGLGGDALYYFVVEDSYTVLEGGITNKYVRDPADDKFYQYDESSESYVVQGTNRIAGKYRPILSNDGTKTDGSTIEVDNSEGVTVSKIWRDTKRNTVLPATENGSPMTITFKVFGKLDGQEVELNLGDENTLSSTDSYKRKLPDSVTITLPEGVSDAYKTSIGYSETKTYNLSEFTDLRVEEFLTGDQRTMLASQGYLVDDVKTSGSATDGFGAFVITNTKQAVENTVDASVEKVWVGTAKENVQVQLIQTQEPLNATQLANYTLPIAPLSNGQDSIVAGVGTASNAYEFTGSLKSGTTPVIEPSGLATVAVSGNTLIVTGGGSEGTGTITLTMEDDSVKVINVSVIKQIESLSGSNNWNKTWSGLPKKTKDGTAEYYYYVLETSETTGYTVDYSINGKDTTITNTQLSLNLKIHKVWAGDDDKDHSGEEIQFVVKRTTDPSKVMKEGETVGNTESIEVAGKTFSVTATPATVYQGGSITLTAKLDDDDVTGSTTFKIGNQEISNSYSNTVPGIYTIRATYTNAGKEYTKDISVEVLKRTLLLNDGDASVDVAVGNVIQLTPSYDSEGTPSGVTYVSSDTSVATVDSTSGNVTGLSAGTTIITATDAYGNTDTITVNVTESVQNDDFTLSGPSSVLVGQQIVITPSDTRGGITYTYTDTDSSTANKASFDATTSDDGTWTVLLKNQGTYVENKTVTITATRGDCTQTKVISVGVQGADVNDALSSGDSIVISLTGTPNTQISCQFGLQNSGWGTIDQVNKPVSFDASGNATVTIDVDADKSATAHVQIWDTNGIVGLQNVSVEKGTTPQTPTFSITPKSSTITEGGYVDFTPSMQNGTLGTVTYTVSPNNENNASVNGNRITFNKAGTYTVTASTTYAGRDYTDTATVTVNAASSSFSVEETDVTVARGARFTITASDTIYALGGLPGWTVITQQPYGNSVEIEVPSWAGDTCTITVAHDDSWSQTAVVNVTVVNAVAGARSQNVLSNRTARPLRAGSMTKTVGADASDSEVTQLFFNTSASDIISMGSGQALNIGMNIGKSIQSAGITDSTASEWTKEITGLPVVDEEGNKYYYWVEEVNVPTGYSASYLDNSIDAMEVATLGNTPTVTITNTKVSESVELPTSGGTGTRIYYTVGGLLLLLSAAGYITMKRRRWSDG